MQTKDKILLCACGLVIILASPFLYVAVISILPNVGVIGVGLTGFILLCIGCASLLVVSFTFSRIGVWNAKSQNARNSANVIVAGNVVLARLLDGTIINLTADVERARSIEGPRETTLNPATDETIIDLYLHGHTSETIAKSCRMTKYEVEKIIREKG